MKTVLRILILSLAAALVIASFAACQKDKPSQDTDTTAEATETVSDTAAQSEDTDTTAAKGEYTGEKWLEKSDDIKEADGFFGGDALQITEIYSDCFFATTVIPLPQTFKINGRLSDEWCVGDVVECEFKNVYYDRDTDHVEADLVSIGESDFELEPDVDYKPVIYLYPEKTTNVHVSLELNGELLCTYPAYDGGWYVVASPDGTLCDKDGVYYNYLYWEGKTDFEKEFSDGFCVKGEDTAKFLEWALDSLGLTRREANEFIVFWLPFMQDNAYNVISFDTASYEEAAKLCINPAPDTLIRVFMTWRASDTYVDLAPQTLEAPERAGFTVVEWGGTVVK